MKLNLNNSLTQKYNQERAETDLSMNLAQKQLKESLEKKLRLI